LIPRSAATWASLAPPGFVISLYDDLRKIWPFYGVLFAVLMLVTFVPALSLWLPALVIK